MIKIWLLILYVAILELGDLDNAEKEIDNLLKKEPKDIWLKFKKQEFLI